MGRDMAIIRPTFSSLIKAIQTAHESLADKAFKAVNISLTLRNWLIGCYLHVYEQNGADRARYGEHLLESIEERLKKENVPRASARELRRYRQFFITYPQIRETLSPEFKAMI